MKSTLDTLQQSKLAEMNRSDTSDTEAAFFADLHVEVDQVAFNVKANEDSIIISLKSFYDGYHLFRRVFLPMLRNNRRRRIFETALNRTNQTIYLQNRYFGLFGPRANPFLRMLLS